MRGYLCNNAEPWHFLAIAISTDLRNYRSTGPHISICGLTLVAIVRLMIFMKHTHSNFILSALVTALTLVACGHGGETTDDGGTESGEATDDPASRGGTETTAPSPECNVTLKGELITSVGDITYENHNLTAQASHLVGDGCVTALDLTFDIDGGCELALSMAAHGGEWTLTSGSFTADSNCGASFPEASHGAYLVDTAQSTAALADAPGTADDAAAESSCLSGDAMQLLGLLTMKSGPQDLTLRLNNLALSGSIASTGVAEGGCPAAPTFCPDNFECGEDPYGVECGECEKGFECNAAHTCEVSLCPPTAPPAFGTEQGDTLQNMTLKDCDGNDFELHNLCGNNATYVNLFAAW